MTRISRSLTAVLLTLAVCAAAPAATQAATYTGCKAVRNPYPHTRYAGVDLTRIRKLHTTCTNARRVARRAHRKALKLSPPESGIRRFTWNGWRVRGDLRPDRDRYLARKGERRVRWRF
jgi:hypothetical protein